MPVEYAEETAVLVLTVPGFLTEAPHSINAAFAMETERAV